MTENVGMKLQDAGPEYGSTPQVVHPSDQDLAILGSLRASEMQTISDRLGRVKSPKKAQIWSVIALLLFGTGGGGILAGIVVMGSKLDAGVKPSYVVATALCFVFAELFRRAGKDVQEQHTETVEAIKQDLDNILARYREPLEQLNKVAGVPQDQEP